MSIIGWIGWAIVAAVIAGFDLTLQAWKHTTLSDTWLDHAHNRWVRPAEAGVYVALGLHLFTGISIYYVFAALVGLILAVIHAIKPT